MSTDHETDHETEEAAFASLIPNRKSEPAQKREAGSVKQLTTPQPAVAPKAAIPKASPKAGRKATKPEKVKEEKRHFTSLITKDNDLRLLSYQATKPGGAKTTDILNEALEEYFNRRRQYADAYLEQKK